jgi:hypothetical protein
MAMEGSGVSAAGWHEVARSANRLRVRMRRYFMQGILLEKNGTFARANVPSFLFTKL